MSKTRLLVIALIAVLLAGNIFLGIEYFTRQTELRQTQALLETRSTNDKVIKFTKLFVNKVLKAQSEVDFETRLRLENAVRDLNNEEILTQWQKFTDSKTEAEAQIQVKNLLEMLVNKISL